MVNERGDHETVLLEAAVDAMQIKPAGKYVDCTFGRGGHSALILERLSESGRLLAVDKDPQALDVAHERFSGDLRFSIQKGSFADMDRFVEERNWNALDGILMDLGVSSPQLDQAERGFSFLNDGPLDMRMDQVSGESAADWINRAEEIEISDVLWKYGEERFSRRMARAIIDTREHSPISRTKTLADIVAKANPRWEKGRHPATRAFQAIRIFINRELEDLEEGLAKAFALLNRGGRLVVISFHSLEDRIVKRYMRNQVQAPQIPKWVPVADAHVVKAKLIAKKVRASEEEVRTNPRSRSAVMRVLEKT